MQPGRRISLGINKVRSYLILSYLNILINTSINSRLFPNTFKTARIKPPKKPPLDTNDVRNYRPVSVAVRPSSPPRPPAPPSRQSPPTSLTRRLSPRFPACSPPAMTSARRRLNYCNSLLAGLPASAIKLLKRDPECRSTLGVQLTKILPCNPSLPRPSLAPSNRSH